MELAPKVRCALDIARQHPAELRHAQQVARLCERLFDALQALHGLGARERELLVCAALLHDIGLSVSISAHHKHSLRLILESALPAFTPEERLLVANVARYHRKSHPSPRHSEFADLAPPARETARRLAAIIRIADGLDRAHEDAVSDADVWQVGEKSWTIRVSGSGDLAFACMGARRKAGLFEEVFDVRLTIEPAVEPDTRLPEGRTPNKPKHKTA
ncbi:MAG: HD domain-containing protein [Planctomycetes bacterium]|nr:HD domain-containing protein [Planctomycetota bacterium]